MALLLVLFGFGNLHALAAPGDLLVVDLNNSPGLPNHSVKRFDGTTGAFLGVFGETDGNLEIPGGIAVHPVTGNIFVGDQTNKPNFIHVIKEFDGVTGAYIGTFGLIGQYLTSGPYSFDFHPSTGNLYIVDFLAKAIKVFDGTNGGFIRSIDLSHKLGGPMRMAFHPGTERLFVGFLGAGQGVDEIDPISGTVIGEFGETGPNIGISGLGGVLGLSFHPVTHNLFVGDIYDNGVKEFDGVTGQYLGVFGDANKFNISTTSGMGFNPVTANLFVANVKDDDVVDEFNGSDGSLIGSFSGTPGNLLYPGYLVFIPLTSTALPASAAQNNKVVSPFWQSGDGIYTFVALTHPSLSGMNSRIGVSVRALLIDGTEYGSRSTFTVDAGSTQRVFIVRANHPNLNPSDLPGSNFIFGPASGQIGQANVPGLGYLVIDSIASNPNAIQPNGGYADVSMLSLWGAVVFEETFTGFAMEFIGDMNDSSSPPGTLPGVFPSGVN